MNNPISTIEISDAKSLPADPLVSVYMLTYHQERFIETAIEGVIAQTCNFPIELIIGEDGSPDKTREIVMKYQKQYPNLIRVLTSEANVGARANARRCQAATRGRYVAICEGDDFWTDPQKLATQVSLLERKQTISLVCHAVNLVDAESGLRDRQHRSAGCSRILPAREVVARGGYFIPTCSILVRRTVLENRPDWWEKCPVGDYPLALRATQLGEVAYMDRVMASYRVNVPGSWTVTRKTEALLHDRYQHAQAMERMLRGFIAEAGPTYLAAARPLIRKYIYNAIVRGPGDLRERRLLLSEARRTLNRFDIFFAHLALYTGRTFVWIRAFPTNVVNFTYGIACDFRSQETFD